MDAHDLENQDLPMESEPREEIAPSGHNAPLSMDAPAAPDFSIEQSIEQAGDQRAWYVVHCYSGYENKVRHNLEQRIETMGMKDQIFDVVIPTQEEIEVKDGKRKTVERHVFPGYVLVNMILSEESWYVVRNTPGVTGFVGMGNIPTPLRPEEVHRYYAEWKPKHQWSRLRLKLVNGSALWMVHSMTSAVMLQKLIWNEVKFASWSTFSVEKHPWNWTFLTGGTSVM